MTLILSYISRNSVIQMSDRLTTTNGVEFDREANKTLVLVAPDGYACVSFCGLAFLNNQPADIFLAEALTGELPDMAGCIPNNGPCLNNKRRRLDDMLYALVRHAETEFLTRRLRYRNAVFGLSVCGWRIRNRGQLSFGYNMLKSSGKYRLDIVEKTLRGAYPLTHDYVADFPPGYINEERQERLDVARAVGFTTIDNLYTNWETCFVDVIRSAADYTGLVGLDGMMAILQPPSERRILIKHIPIQQVHGNWEFARNVPCAFTPWVIGQHSFLSPSLMTQGPGEMNYHVGGVDVELHVPPNDQGIMHIGGYPRRMI